MTTSPDPIDPAAPNVAVVSGGVGAARFLRGLQAVVPPARITAIVNTGDDTVLHGLTICPDLDTITYTLAEAIDPERGWGLAGETWHAMEALARYEPVRPAGSAAATTWFGLGDRDLATHLYRTARRAEGATSTEIADEVRRAWGLDIRLLPMTDDPLATIVELATGEDVSFQDYFVRLRHGVPVRGVHFAGDAAPTGAAIDALTARRRHRDRAVEPGRVDRTGAVAARHRRAAHRPPTSGRRRVTDRRRRGPQGPGRPDAGRARPRPVRGRRGSAVRTDRRRAGHRPRRRRAGPAGRGGGDARRRRRSRSCRHPTSPLRWPGPRWPPLASRRAQPARPTSSADGVERGSGAGDDRVGEGRRQPVGVDEDVGVQLPAARAVGQHAVARRRRPRPVRRRRRRRRR